MEQTFLSRFEVATTLIALALIFSVLHQLIYIPYALSTLATSQGDPLLGGCILALVLAALAPALLWLQAPLLARLMVGEQGEATVDSLRASRPLWIPAIGILLAASGPSSLPTKGVMELFSASDWFQEEPRIILFCHIAQAGSG